MIKVNFYGRMGCGKTTAIEFAMKALRDLDYNCFNLDGGRGGVTTKFKGILFTSSLSEGPLNFDITGDCPKAVRDQVELATYRALAQIEDWKADRFAAEVQKKRPTDHPGYLIWNPNGPGRPGYVHSTMGNAVGEARRMANIHPENTFFILAPIAAYRAERIVQPVESLKIVNSAPDFDLDDHIPF